MSPLKVTYHPTPRQGTRKAATCCPMAELEITKGETWSWNQPPVKISPHWGASLLTVTRSWFPNTQYQML